MMSRCTDALPATHPTQKSVADRLSSVLNFLNERLGKATWLAGDEFTAADIMSVFSLTTMRFFYAAFDLTPYPNILAYLQRVGARKGFKEALRKGDPEMVPALGGPPPELFTGNFSK